MADEFDGETDLLGSREPANNSIGRNGYQGPSSATNPAKAPKIKGYSHDTFVPKKNEQLRVISDKQLPATFGTKDPNGHPAQILNAISRQGSSIRKR